MKMNQQINRRLIQDKPGITVEFECRFQQKDGRKKVARRKASQRNPSSESQPPHHIPRTAKLLALAHYYRKLVDDGTVKDYAEIARLTGTSRARISQIISLTFLAPDIQKEILFLPPGKHHPKQSKERNLRKALQSLVWKEQIEIWNHE
jgi:hypothetical protein